MKRTIIITYTNNKTSTPKLVGVYDTEVFLDDCPIDVWVYYPDRDTPAVSKWYTRIKFHSGKIQTNATKEKYIPKQVLAMALLLT